MERVLHKGHDAEVILKHSRKKVAVELQNFVLEETGKCVSEILERYGGGQNRICLMMKYFVCSFNKQNQNGSTIKLCIPYFASSR